MMQLQLATVFVRRTFLLAIGLCTATFCVNAQQIDEESMYAFLADGYTITEMEEIIAQQTVKQLEKYLKKQGYKLEDEDKEKNMQYYRKNKVVSLAVFYDRADKHLREVQFYSSPQKYYQAITPFEKGSGFRKIEEKKVQYKSGSSGTETRWVKNGFVYFANDAKYSIGMYLDENNEAAKTFRPAVVKTTPGQDQTATANTKTTPQPVYDFSTAQKLADSLNKYMSGAWILNTKNTMNADLNYKFSITGRTSFEKSSIQFFAKNNKLYIKTHIPKAGECNYGQSESEAVFINNGSIGTTPQVYENGEYRSGKTIYTVFAAFKYTHTCAGIGYENIQAAWPDKDKNFNSQIISSIKAFSASGKNQN